MPARPVHRFGTSDRLFKGAASGTLDAIQPGDAVLFGLARSGDGSQAVRDASWSGAPPAATGRALDLGDAEAQAPHAARAIRARGGRPVLLGGSIGDAAALLPPPGERATILLISDRLDLDAGLLDSGPKLAFGTHDLLPAASVARWRAAGGQIVEATGAAPFAERAAAAIRKAASTDSAALILDLNAIDTGHAAGSDGLNVGGLSPLECLDLVRTLAAAFAIGTVAVVDLAPERDPRGHAEMLAAEAIHLLLAPHAARAAA